MEITSKNNPVVKSVGSLAQKKSRKESGLYIAEGIKPVRECLRAGCNIDRIVCTAEHKGEFENATVVSEAVFKNLSSEKNPQGVLAVIKIPENTLRPPKSSCILLDCLQDPGNIGTVIRTANAAGYKEIYLINCVDPYSPKAVRASMSGIFFVNVYSDTAENVLAALEKVPIICADMKGEDIFSFNPPEKYCLCIGNEGGGISERVLSRAAHTVKIPMSKTCESLNAAVSAGIAMYTLKNNLKRGV